MSSKLWSLKNIDEIDRLLDLSSDEFLEAAYQALLKRPPDSDGKRFYLTRLRSGYSKAGILVQIACSPEAKVVGRAPGSLARTIRGQQGALSWISRPFGRARRIEAQVNRLEFRLDQLARRIEVSPSRGADRRQVADQGTMVESASVKRREEAGDDVYRLSSPEVQDTPRTREIVARLQRACGCSAQRRPSKCAS
jgi:hypothetical protein